MAWRCLDACGRVRRRVGEPLPHREEQARDVGSPALVVPWGHEDDRDDVARAGRRARRYRAGVQEHDAGRLAAGSSARGLTALSAARLMSTATTYKLGNES